MSKLYPPAVRLNMQHTTQTWVGQFDSLALFHRFQHMVDITEKHTSIDNICTAIHHPETVPVFYNSHLVCAVVISTLQMCAVYWIINHHPYVRREQTCLSKIGVRKCFQESSWADQVFTFKSKHRFITLIKCKCAKLQFWLHSLNHVSQQHQ